MRVALLCALAWQVALCRVFERCELVRELSQPKYRIPSKELATWVCIARHESEFNTSAVGHLNADGSGDHGLFQISDQFWCSPPGVGLACGLNCDQLEDDDITDDVVCARRIYRAHKRRTGDGFTAWVVYGTHCRGDVGEYLQGCDDGEGSDGSRTNTESPELHITSHSQDTSDPTSASSITTPTSAAGSTTRTSVPTISLFATRGTSTSPAPETRHSNSRTIPKPIQNPRNTLHLSSKSNPSSVAKPVFTSAARLTPSRTAGSQRPTFAKDDPDPKTAWLRIHNDPRFLDEYP